MATIVTRAGKGSALTHNEADANFVNLNNAKFEAGNNATFGTVGGTTITASTGFAGALNGTVGATTPAAGTFTSLTDSGNLNFTGTGNRITGDMSNTTHNNRLSFQTSTINGATSPFFIPNGSGNIASVVVANSSDLTNTSFGQLVVAGTSDVRLISGTLGSGTALPLTMLTNGSERMRIDTSGNVGIGTSSPSFKLDVSGSGQQTIRAITTDTSGFQIARLSARYTGGGGGATSQIDIRAGDGFTQILNETNTPMLFGTNNTERMRIDSSGNLLVGTTSGFGGSNSISIAKNAPVLTLNNGSVADGAASLFIIKAGSTSSTSQIYTAFSYNSGANGNGGIAGNGDSQATFITVSDERLKQNITNLPEQLKNIMSLRPVEFDYKKTGGHQIGFIAQEVQEIYPDLVTEGKDGYLTLAGFDKNTARLVKAIQELSAKVDTLQAELNTLKGN